MNNFLLFWQKQMPFCKTNSAMKTTARFLVLLAGCIGWVSSHGQQAKSPVQLGDQYFAAGEYYTAAHLYGQFLNPSKKQKTTSDFPLYTKGRRVPATSKGVSRTAILFKQAESYRLANYWNEAAVIYKEFAEKYPAEYPDALYWHAVSERSLGNYSSAEESLKKYLSGTAATRYKEAAEKEQQTLVYIRQQLARPDSILIKTYKLDAPGSNEKGLFAPAHIGGNQFLISSTQTDSAQVNGINPHHSRLFYATLNNGSLEAMTPAGIPANSPADNLGAATISADGKYLYFSQWKKEKGRTVSSVYYSVKESSGWSQPTLLSSLNANGYSSKQPFCSKDGKYLFFASDKPGGAGGFDIWYALLKTDGTTGEPVNAGTIINTSGDEQAPFYHNSSTTLVFSSNARAGMGGYDLYTAKGSEINWKMPENLGHPVNSSRDDIYFFAPENAGLLSNAIFSSDRGTGCCLETYAISKAAKSRQLSGVLRDCKDNTPVANAEVVLKDAGGKIWRTTTDADGRYLFSIGSDIYENLVFTINKELYTESVSPLKISNTDESDFLTDKLTSADVCIEKKPEPPKLVIKAEDVVTVYFDFDRSRLERPALNKLDSIYNVMVEYPAATIQISGYTDGRGSEEYNQKLSDRRARACADYLVKKGIDASRISFVSFGACCPVEMELINGRDNPDGRSRNRRALINVKKE
jgi:OOP family OmpA-OmpF porin